MPCAVDLVALAFQKLPLQVYDADQLEMEQARIRLEYCQRRMAVLQIVVMISTSPEQVSRAEKSSYQISIEYASSLPAVAMTSLLERTPTPFRLQADSPMLSEKTRPDPSSLHWTSGSATVRAAAMLQTEIKE